MTTASETILFERYPALFSDGALKRHRSGIETGDGWFDLLDETFYQLNLVRSVSRVEFSLACVKSKFAGLRIYRGVAEPPEGMPEAMMNAWMSIVEAIISRAEGRAVQTCEFTGKDGKCWSVNGWLWTLCADKAREMGGVTLEEYAKRREAAAAKSKPA